MPNSHQQHETPTLDAALKAFIREQKLPLQYLEMAEKWFFPDSSILTHLKSTQNQVLIVGINGLPARKIDLATICAQSEHHIASIIDR